MLKKISNTLLAVIFFVTLTSNTFAATISTENKSISVHQQVLDKISGNLVLENNKVNLDVNNTENLEDEELAIIPEVLEDLNFLYQKGNIYFDSNDNLAVRAKEELEEELEEYLDEIEENNNDSYESDIMPIPGFDEPENFALERYVKANSQYLTNYYNDYVDLMIKYPSLIILPQLETQIEFASKVAEGKAWDYKREIGWNTLRKVTIDGKPHYLTGEDIGNIHYGYIGRDMDFSTATLCKAGGLVQVLTSKGASLKQFSYDSYYDDPTDQAAIKRGTSWYDNGSFK